MEEILIKKHHDFWKNKSGVVLRSQLDFNREPFRKRVYNENIKGPFTHQTLDTDWLIEAYAKAFQGRPVINGDVLEFVQYAFVVPWMEGIIGCKLYSLGRGASMVAHPSDIETANLPQHLKNVLESLDENVWFQKLGDGIEGVVKELQGKYPVSQTLLRGPGDMLGALIGYENLVTRMLNPADKDYLHELLDLCSSIWIETISGRSQPFAVVFTRWIGIKDGSAWKKRIDFLCMVKE